MTPYYDSLLARIIAHDGDRERCLNRLQHALANCHIDGVDTNLGMHHALLAASEFRRGGVDTSFFARFESS